jgi:hypothetical protein
VPSNSAKNYKNNKLDTPIFDEGYDRIILTSKVLSLIPTLTQIHTSQLVV